MNNKKHLFDIPDSISYLNTASLSPSFKSVEDAGIKAVKDKSRPYYITSSHFFDPVSELKQRFSKTIDCDEPDRVALSPSVSYGLANMANNVCLKPNDQIIVIEEQFPSNYYIWEHIAKKYKAQIITIKQPKDHAHCGSLWNEAILDAVTDQTAIVALGNIHWSNGLIFDLKAIRKKTRAHNALLIVDGSQSIGALPFSIKEIEPDALVCAGYKWLFGPYGCAYAYYGSYFDQGEPIEHNWTNRLHSENLRELTNYQDAFKPLANRYMVGESGSFIHVQMQLEALKQVCEFKPQNIQDYCHGISHDILEDLQTLGYLSYEPESRAKHLFGLQIPNDVDIRKLKQLLQERNIFVSYRGQYLRLSAHLFNTKLDFERLYKTLKEVKTA